MISDVAQTRFQHLSFVQPKWIRVYLKIFYYIIDSLTIDAISFEILLKYFARLHLRDLKLSGFVQFLHVLSITFPTNRNKFIRYNRQIT